ncbi:hypothetical protein QTN25_004833 [Entamoeba marina]
MCKATERCIAMDGLEKKKGDRWVMKQTTDYCSSLPKFKKNQCFKTAFDIMFAATHINDPLKFNIKSICKKYNHC